MEKETYFHNKWRPAMGWSYLCVCVFDFLVAPIVYVMIQVIFGDGNVAQLVAWEPQTIKGGGLYHISMLTIVGVTAYGRTKEKLQGTAEMLNELRNIIQPKVPVPEPETKPDGWTKAEIKPDPGEEIK